MDLREILFYGSLLVVIVGYCSFKYYEKKYESFKDDLPDEEE